MAQKTKAKKAPKTLKEFALSGGQATLKKYGKKYFSEMSKKRWAKTKKLKHKDGKIKKS